MRRVAITITVFLLCLFAVSCLVSATEVDMAFLCNLEGHPGDVIEETITLTSTSSTDRTGKWEVFYDKREGDTDTDKMDITSWIKIEPEDYELKPGKSKSFVVKIRIPSDASPGLWGATSVDAATVGGHPYRRTYIRFMDADAEAVKIGGGAVAWTAFRIPVSVKVLGTPNPIEPIVEEMKENMLVIVLIAIIIVLAVMLMRRSHKR